jgi:hypothetical protein
MRRCSTIRRCSTKVGRQSACSWPGVFKVEKLQGQGDQHEQKMEGDNVDVR